MEYKWRMDLCLRQTLFFGKRKDLVSFGFDFAKDRGMVTGMDMVK